MVFRSAYVLALWAFRSAYVLALWVFRYTSLLIYYLNAFIKGLSAQVG
jgi:hypothetical protein